MPYVVCVRSLVPNEKNSAVSAISAAFSAARGSSIIVPTWYMFDHFVGRTVGEADLKGPSASTNVSCALLVRQVTLRPHADFR